MIQIFEKLVIFVNKQAKANVLRKQRIEFSSRQIQDAAINRSFVQLLNGLKTEKEEKTDLLLKNFIYQIFPHSNTVSHNTHLLSNPDTCLN